MASAEGTGVVGAGQVRRGISAVVAVAVAVVVRGRMVEAAVSAGGGAEGPVVPTGDEVDLVAP